MLKEKFLHRHSRNHKKRKFKQGYTKMTMYRGELPFHQSMRDYHRTHDDMYYSYSDLDFTPVYKYLYENVDRNWNDIYSEVIKKTRPRFRYLLDDYLGWTLTKNIIFEEHIPYIYHWFGRTSGIVLERFFIDENNILRYYTSEEEAMKNAQILVRQDKIKKLIEISKKLGSQQSNQ